MGLFKMASRLLTLVTLLTVAVVALAVYTVLDRGEGLRKFGKSLHEHTEKVADFAKSLHDNAETMIKGAEEIHKDINYAKDTISNTISILGNAIDRDKEPEKELPDAGRGTKGP